MEWDLWSGYFWTLPLKCLGGQVTPTGLSHSESCNQGAVLTGSDSFRCCQVSVLWGCSDLESAIEGSDQYKGWLELSHWEDLRRGPHVWDSYSPQVLAECFLSDDSATDITPANADCIFWASEHYCMMMKMMMLWWWHKTPRTSIKFHGLKNYGNLHCRLMILVNRKKTITYL